MVGKSHCFSEFDDEYEDFYQPNTSIVPSVGYVDEVGELHFNGEVYGQRMYQRYYKQKLRDPEEIRRGQRQTITGPVAPRESIALERCDCETKGVLSAEVCLEKGEAGGIGIGWESNIVVVVFLIFLIIFLFFVFIFLFFVFVSSSSFSGNPRGRLLSAPRRHHVRWTMAV
jgi:hypothetical protein